MKYDDINVSPIKSLINSKFLSAETSIVIYIFRKKDVRTRTTAVTKIIDYPSSRLYGTGCFNYSAGQGIPVYHCIHKSRPLNLNLSHLNPGDSVFWDVASCILLW
jgi:hypothetical protein